MSRTWTSSPRPGADRGGPGAGRTGTGHGGVSWPGGCLPLSRHPTDRAEESERPYVPHASSLSPPNQPSANETRRLAPRLPISQNGRSPVAARRRRWARRVLRARPAAKELRQRAGNLRDPACGAGCVSPDSKETRWTAPPAWFSHEEHVALRPTSSRPVSCTIRSSPSRRSTEPPTSRT